MTSWAIWAHEKCELDDVSRLTSEVHTTLPRTPTPHFGLKVPSVQEATGRERFLILVQLPFDRCDQANCEHSLSRRVAGRKANVEAMIKWSASAAFRNPQEPTDNDTANRRWRWAGLPLTPWACDRSRLEHDLED